MQPVDRMKGVDETASPGSAVVVDLLNRLAAAGRADLLGYPMSTTWDTHRSRRLLPDEDRAAVVPVFCGFRRVRCGISQVLRREVETGRSGSGPDEFAVFIDEQLHAARFASHDDEVTGRSGLDDVPVALHQANLGSEPFRPLPRGHETIILVIHSAFLSGGEGVAATVGESIRGHR
jgi:hypothetical protein